MILQLYRIHTDSFIKDGDFIDGNIEIAINRHESVNVIVCNVDLNRFL